MHRGGRPPAAPPEAFMHFLFVDDRFGTPIYVFLERDPHGQDGYPGMSVREVSLEAGPHSVAGRRCELGRDPARLGTFREFASSGAVARAGYILIEPHYVGPNWDGYCHHFKPEGTKPPKKGGRPVGPPARLRARDAAG